MADDEVEIRLRVTEDQVGAKAPAAPSTGGSPSAPQNSPAVRQPFRFSQAERDAAEQSARLEDFESKFEKAFSRIEYRMKRIGARMLAGAAVSEIGGMIGFENSSLGRIATNTAAGALMAGPTGALSYGTLTIIHELINQVRESMNRTSELQNRLDAQLAKELDQRDEMRIEFGEAQRKLQEETEAAVEEFNRRVNDYTLNAMRYITVPYTGRG